MANPSWTDYISVAAGIVGMVTGISGAVMGYIGYRHSKQIKALDLRLALQKDLAEVRESIGTLRQMMSQAGSSRKATMVARGVHQSGAMKVWEAMIEADRAEVSKIAAAIPREGTDFSAMSEEQLASEIVATHKIKTSLFTLTEKYRAELAADADSHRQSAAQQAAMMAARIQAARPPG